MKQRLLFLLVLLLTCMGFPQTRTVNITVNNRLGAFTLLNGINCGPYSKINRQDYTRQLKDLGIRGVRTHDFQGPCDWSTIFPNWSADPNLESSYNFGSTDTVIASIVNAGMDILFRLGNSYRGSRPVSVVDPPGTLRDGGGNVTHAADTTDFKKFANICKHIVMHYNDGWKNGFRYNITRWEIWNEPANPVEFWSGTYEQFRQMFAIVAKEIKNYNGSLLVGGPAQAGNVTDAPFNDSLVAYCARQGAPMDFWSWHYYMNSQNAVVPYQFVKKAQTFSAMLTRYGYTQSRQYCDEWNAGTNSSAQNAYTKGAVFAAAALTYLSDAVAESYLYRGDYHPLGMFDSSSNPRRIVDGFAMWNYLTGSNALRLNTTGTDTLGFTAISSVNSSNTSVRVLLANYSSAAKTVTVQATGVSALAPGTITQLRFLTDTTHRFTRTDSVAVTRRDTLAATFTMEAYTAQLVEFRVQGTTGVDGGDVPEGFSLRQNYPNPFNPETTIRFNLAASGFTTVRIYSVGGEEIVTVAAEQLSAGSHSYTVSMAGLPSGVYLCRLQSGGKTAAIKMLLVK